MNKQEVLANNIRALMKQKGVDCVDISWRVDMELASVYRIVEARIKKPSKYGLERIAGMFGVTVNDLYEPDKFYTVNMLESKEQKKETAKKHERCSTCGYYRPLNGVACYACHYAVRALAKGRYTRTKHNAPAPKPEECPYYDQSASTDDLKRDFVEGLYEEA